jgi:RHS repeat-associated protein
VPEDLFLGLRFYNGRLVDEQHYYPFGLTIKDGGQNSTGLHNAYQFQGNALQGELKLNLYDFNFRQYDQTIGRFMSVDPLADFYGQEQFSPHHFRGNNPANIVDPLGLGETTLMGFVLTHTGIYKEYLLDDFGVKATRIDRLNDPLYFLDGAGSAGYNPSSVTNTSGAQGSSGGALVSRIVKTI